MKKFLLFAWAILGLVLVGVWLHFTPPGLLGKADAIGYAVCARNPAHSFFFGARQMPLCSRCTGMHTGILLTLIWLWLTAPRRSAYPPRPLQAVLALFAIAFAADGINSWVTDALGHPWLYTPSNTLRLFSGLGMGIALGAFIHPIANAVLWELPDSRRVMDWRGFTAVLFGAGLAAALILTANPLVLFPVALLATADVVMVLTLIYTLLACMALRCENTARTWSNLRLPLAIGASAAFLQIALFDLMRFALTGTWGYFPH